MATPEIFKLHVYNYNSEPYDNFMSKTVRVKIGGQEYNLRSDDDARVRAISERVDTQMQHLRNKIQDQSTSTLAILTALNIAEKEYESLEQARADTTYIVAELEKMSAFLQQCYSDDNNS